jgi:hypothetical protein
VPKNWTTASRSARQRLALDNHGTAGLKEPGWPFAQRQRAPRDEAGQGYILGGFSPLAAAHWFQMVSATGPIQP